MRRAAAPPPEPDPYPRVVSPNGRVKVVRRGRRQTQLDFYYAVLTAPVWGLLLGMAAVYLVVNLAFAGLYLLQPHTLSDPRASFFDVLYMSIQLFSGTGLSQLQPISPYGHLVAGGETFVGLVNLSIMAGLMFSRVARPTARIMFSKVAVITEFEGRPHFMFRAANQRANQILEAEVDVSFACQVKTREGRTIRRFQDVRVVRRRSPLFALTWTVMHPIDEASPFHGQDRRALLENMVEVVVSISGTDETLADRIHARHSYMPHEIEWGADFADVLSLTEDGRRVIDYDRFHDIERGDS